MADAIPTVRLAATLLHFAWQGLAIALVAWALMTLVRSATARYGIGCAALVAMLIAPIVTFLLLTPAQSDRHAALLADHPASATAMTPTPAATALPLTVKPPPPAWHERLAPIAPFAVAAWLAGVAAIGMRHALGLAGVARLRRNAMPVTDDVLLARLAHLSARLGIRRRVMLLNTVDLDAPAVIGWLRPAILWPASLMSGLTPAQLDGLLAHELAHVRRHDYLVNLLQSLVETLLFYHPAVWWLSRRIRQEREHCCDDIAARAIGDRAGYAEALVALEWSRSASPLVLASNGGTLMTRVERLVAPVSAGRPAWFGAGALFATIVLVIAAVLWTQGTRIAAARAGDEQAAKGPTTAPTTAAPTTQRGDYRISSGDLVRVSVMDLTGAGVETSLIKRVASSGNITLPYVDEVAVAGLTDQQAERAIRKAYGEKQVIREANVNVLVIEGANGQRIAPELFATASTAATKQELAEVSGSLADIAAYVREAAKRDAERTAAEKRRAEYPKAEPAPATRASSAAIERSIADKEPFYARLLQQRDEFKLELAKTAAAQGANAAPVVTMRQTLSAVDAQIAKITQQYLNTPGIGWTGTYYVGGHVARPGAYSLSGRPMNLLQAIIAAGIETQGPDRVRIVRRWPDPAKEQIIDVEIDASRGTGSAVEVLPEDSIIVGANAPPADVPTTAPTTIPAAAP